jgi:hypothetical protein
MQTSCNNEQSKHESWFIWYKISCFPSRIMVIANTIMIHDKITFGIVKISKDGYYNVVVIL